MRHDIMQPKQLLIEKFEKLILKNKNLKILDLGSGQSRNFLPLLEKFPYLHYLGVEPNKRDADVASDLLKKFKNAKILNQLAYQKIDCYDNFDICISLSVLEHVKQLDLLLKNSIRSVKKGGQIIHRYDLGHSLYPNTLKEKFHIFLGNKFPKILPERKFIRYLDQNEVCKILQDNGAEITSITYHQMPNHKSFLKFFQTDSEEKLNLAKEILEWEFRVSKYLQEIEQKQRELLFPCICIWAIKK